MLTFLGQIKITASKFKQDRPILPKVIIITAGTPDETLFHNLLLEDQSSFGSSYAQFLEFIQVYYLTYIASDNIRVKCLKFELLSKQPSEFFKYPPFPFIQIFTIIASNL